MKEQNWIIREIMSHANETPKRLAIVEQATRVTYSDLWGRVERLASSIVANLGGVRPLAICMPRSLDQILVTLASLRAGIGFASVDPYNIGERTVRALSSSGAEFLCVSANLKGSCLSELGAGRDWIDSTAFIGDPALISMTQESFTESASKIQHAYTLFTSGSTSLPKGVRMGVPAIVELIRWHVSRPWFLSGAQAAFAASPGFDASVHEILSALCSGSTLHIVDQRTKIDPVRFSQFLIDAEINRLFVTPTLLHMLCSEFQTTGLPKTLSHLVVSGEELVISQSVRKAIGSRDNVTLENQYGPTETHVVTGAVLDGETARWPDRPTIGRPLPHVKIRVVDADGVDSKPGDPGELHIGGTCVAIGYTDKEKTDQRFYVWPKDGTRYYCSGDLVCILDNGEIEYRGRIDDQVKVRGHRVELSEIECVLRLCPSIREVRVGIADHNGLKRIAAIVVSDKQNIASTSESVIKRFLADQLPSYMHPEIWVFVDEIPISSNGKLLFDKSLVPTRLPRSIESKFEQPTNSLEKTIAEIWEDVLCIDRVGRFDNFFELGGNSLNLIKVLHRVKKELSITMPIEIFMKKPTIQGVSDSFENRPAPRSM